MGIAVAISARVPKYNGGPKVLDSANLFWRCRIRPENTTATPLCVFFNFDLFIKHKPDPFQTSFQEVYHMVMNLYTVHINIKVIASSFHAVVMLLARSKGLRVKFLGLGRFCVKVCLSVNVPTFTLR